MEEMLLDASENLTFAPNEDRRDESLVHMELATEMMMNVSFNDQSPIKQEKYWLTEE